MAKAKKYKFPVAKPPARKRQPVSASSSVSALAEMVRDNEALKSEVLQLKQINEEQTQMILIYEADAARTKQDAPAYKQEEE